MEKAFIGLSEASVVEDDVIKRIKTTGVRGLDFEKAKELGFFARISNLLCVCHATIMASYRIYCGVSSLLNDFNARRNDIAREMNLFEKAFGRFTDFWTGYYAHGGAGVEVNEETETLFRRLMEWAQLPISWNLGDPQRVEDNDLDVAIRMSVGEKQYTFRQTVLGTKQNDDDIKESWCVTKFDIREHTQTCIEENMDKASAMMVAKRLSADDQVNIYTASVVHEYTERKTDITPYKAYKCNKTVGRLMKVQK